MTSSVDPTFDWLADASLSPEQRQIWNQMRTELISARARISDLDKRLKLLQQQPDEDHNQAILNRPEFNREVARMLAFDERYGGTSSVLYFDFENLEAATSRFGKAITIATLREISNLLVKSVRGSDVVGRLATAEFGILLVRCNNEEAWKKGKRVADTLKQNLAEIQGNKINLEISFGAYTFRDSEDVAKGLKEAAQMVTKNGNDA